MPKVSKQARFYLIVVKGICGFPCIWHAGDQGGYYNLPKTHSACSIDWLVWLDGRWGRVRWGFTACWRGLGGADWEVGSGIWFLFTMSRFLMQGGLWVPRWIRISFGKGVVMWQMLLLLGRWERGEYIYPNLTLVSWLLWHTWKFQSSLRWVSDDWKLILCVKECALCCAGWLKWENSSFVVSKFALYLFPRPWLQDDGGQDRPESAAGPWVKSDVRSLLDLLWLGLGRVAWRCVYIGR